ncbi:uncharacterized protein KGF55_003919 [Candida pseudojiufengensis]|uniref:uncharacterized protein n=1 Tax=Candida pseudojiufengensis TaxID=497109 RepID=UPI00222492CB|nr:uncharacterized protein KGF55_003919 [Candida pseudojiufengensis]KAI5961602.1 hypothetical protein KGF55_003919 [Candida pseudojiufengensis]
MKFGNNLQYLSIPEWKSYNIDYNDLKYKIKQITNSNSKDLTNLNKSFIENIDYINLFIQTKYGELNRKFKYLERIFENLRLKNNEIEIEEEGHNEGNNTNNLPMSESYENFIDIKSLLIEVDELFYQSIELSIILKNLSKFILIQKIAIKKIFKKFLKYYKHKQLATKFIMNIKNYLLENQNSFINFDLTNLTLKLTNFINLIEYERKILQTFNQDYLNSQTTGNNNSTNNNQLHRKNSLFSIASTLNSSDYQNSILPSKYCGNSNQQQIPSTNGSYFDLIIQLKKNFQCHCLIPNDLSNDVILNFNIYLNLKCIEDDLISIIYLNHDLLNEPAMIITSSKNSKSIIIAPTGGLRKNSYCILDNEIVEIFLLHLKDRSNESYKNKLSESFQNSSQLTKKTINFIISNNYLPTSRLICKRSRFKIEKFDNEDDENHQEFEINSTTNTNQDENDYYIALNSDIYTTNKPVFINTINFPQTFEKFDIFPHNHLGIYSNDINLFEFESSLTTKIDKNGIISNEFHLIYLKKFPKILTIILNNNFINLYKKFNFYQYQLSCYYNIIPNNEFINNHYSNLLNLNLLKNFENVSVNNQQLNEEENIIKRKSNNIIKHKLSIQSIQNQKSQLKPSKNSFGSSIFEQVENVQSSCGSLSPQDINFTDDEEDIIEISKLKSGSKQEFNQINKIFESIYNLKQKFFNMNPINEEKNQYQIYENPFYNNFNNNEEIDPYTKLLSIMHNQNYQNNSTYDSINEEPIGYLQRNEFKLQYEINYDKTLSYIYFSLNIISLFLMGIQLGIIYSIYNNLDGNNNYDNSFLIRYNLNLFIILIFGMLISLLFNLISINLLYYRFQKGKKFHYLVIWLGFGINLIGCFWNFYLLLSHF